MSLDLVDLPVSRISAAMMRFLLAYVLNSEDAEGIGHGLPAGAVQLANANLIVAATVCDPPMFRQAASYAAASTKSDVLIGHHGFHPETLNAVEFSLVVHIGGYPVPLERMHLYVHPAEGFWLVPSGAGPCVALEGGGLRLDHEPPFIADAQRVQGLCDAARLIVRAMRGMKG